MEGRRASVRVLYDGVDISADLKDYLISLSYADNIDDQADDLQIDLADREQNWQGPFFPMIREQSEDDEGGSGTTSPILPPTQGNEDIMNTGGNSLTGAQAGSRLTAFIDVKNWDDTETLEAFPCGVFEIDQISLKGPPDTVTIKATSVPPTSSLRNQRNSRAWEEVRLSRVARDLASENGLELRFESADDPYFDRLDQLEMSDMEYLQGLCSDNGLSLKATGTELVIFKQSEYEADAPVMTIERGASDLVSYSFEQKSNDIYSSAEVTYHDSKSGETLVGTFEDPDKSDSGFPTLIINERPASVDTGGSSGQDFSDITSSAQADKLAQESLRDKNKSENQVTFTLLGCPKLCAGVTVMVRGWGKFDGKYFVASSKHDVSPDYITTITCHMILEY